MASQNTATFESLTIGIKIGAGSEGEVFEGMFLERKVAVKILDKYNEKDCKELKNLQACQGHDGIISLLGSFVVDLRRHIVMEYCIGNMQDKIFLKGEAGKAAVQLISAVAFVHDQRFIHGDIKPLNCLNDVHGNCRLADFGMAVKMNEDGSFHGCSGTAGYIPLEVEVHKMQSAKSDVFSVGATIYHFLTKTSLFIVSDNESDSDILRNIRHGIRVMHPLKGQRQPFQESQVPNSPFVRLPGTCKYKRIKTSERLEQLGPVGLLIGRMVNNVPDLRPTCKEMLDQHVSLLLDFSANQPTKVVKIAVPSRGFRSPQSTTSDEEDDDESTDKENDENMEIDTTPSDPQFEQIKSLQAELHQEFCHKLMYKNEANKLRQNLGKNNQDLREKNKELSFLKKQLQDKSKELADLKQKLESKTRELTDIKQRQDAEPKPTSFNKNNKTVPLPEVFKCEICDKAFANKYILQRHQKGHEQKNVLCLHRDCEKKFTRLDEMQAHFVRRHIKDKATPKTCNAANVLEHMKMEHS